MMKDGWIKLYRKLLDNEFLRKDGNAFIVFIRLLLIVDRKTGQWAGGRFQLSELTGLKPTTVRKSALRLQNAKMVTLSSNTKYTTFSICNWANYQGNGDTSSDNKVTTKGQQSDTLTRSGELRSKESITSALTSGDKVSDVIRLFGNINPSYEQLFKRSNQRSAAERLLAKYGLDTLAKYIEVARQANGQEFAPTITTPCQLEDKLGQLKSFYDKNQKKGVKVWKIR